MLKVNGKMLTWAREDCGLSLEDAALKLGYKDSKQSSAAEKLLHVEKTGEISKSAFTKAQTTYRKPVLTYYLNEPPIPTSVGEDFRTPESAGDPRQNNIVKAILSNVVARQSMIKELLVTEDEVQHLKFIGSLNMSMEPETAATKIRELFDITLTEYRKGTDYGRSFNYLRKKIEAKGIFVLIKGNLGNYHSDVEVGTFRGFAISDEIAPFIVINHQEAKSSRAYTLVHELTHVLLGKTGISADVGEDKVERFCDRVASLVLLSDHELKYFSPATELFSQLSKDISDFALAKKVSSTQVAYRLFQLHKITSSAYRKLCKFYYEQWLSSKKAERNKDDGGPNQNVIKKSYLGGIVDFVHRMFESGAISSTQAGIVLDTHPTRLGNFFNNATPH